MAPASVPLPSSKGKKKVGSVAAAGEAPACLHVQPQPVAPSGAQNIGLTAMYTSCFMFIPW